MFHNVTLNNLENVLLRYLKTGRSKDCIFRAFGGEKKFLSAGNHGGAFLGSVSVLVCSKKPLYTSLQVKKNIFD